MSGPNTNTNTTDPNPASASNQNTHPTEEVKEYASKFLTANAKWAERLNQTFPQYFPDFREKQAPKILWLGCSDSRVHESDAMAAFPGTAFVHRNVANQFNPKDDNALSVLTYAVNQLGIQHIVIVGHEHCSGVATAMKEARRPSSVSSSQKKPRLWRFLHETLHTAEDMLHVHFHKDEHHESEEEAIQEGPNYAIMRWLTPLEDRLRKIVLPKDEETASRIATEENVKMQVENLVNMGAFVQTWARKKPVWVHGWVYDTSTGFIRDLQVTKVVG